MRMEENGQFTFLTIFFDISLDNKCKKGYIFVEAFPSCSSLKVPFGCNDLRHSERSQGRDWNSLARLQQPSERHPRDARQDSLGFKAIELSSSRLRSGARAEALEHLCSNYSVLHKLFFY